MKGRIGLHATHVGATLAALAHHGGARLRALFVVAAVIATVPALAGEYAVSPVRVYLDSGAQSAAISLRNLGADPMDFQVAVREWTQHGDGKDRYADTSDVVFFPKILRVEPNEERIVRIGAKVAPATMERTYRLFIEPIQARAEQPLAPGAHIAVNVRFALPVFVKPPQAQAKGEIDSVVLNQGSLAVVVRNTGNEHFRMDEGVAMVGRDEGGATVYTGKLDERYVLAGATRRFEIAIPKASCQHLATLEISAKAEQFTLSRMLVVNRAHCE
jgi:fimbrial chaperone protein